MPHALKALTILAWIPAGAGLYVVMVALGLRLLGYHVELPLGAVVVWFIPAEVWSFVYVATLRTEKQKDGSQ